MATTAHWSSVIHVHKGLQHNCSCAPRLSVSRLNLSTREEAVLALTFRPHDHVFDLERVTEEPFERKVKTTLSVNDLHESDTTATQGGCFPEESWVTRDDGRRIRMRDVRPGDKVLSMDSAGHPVFSEVLTFMDRDSRGPWVYYTIHTEDRNTTVTATPSHLVFVTESRDPSAARVAKFMSDVRPGEFLLTPESAGGGFRKVEIVSVTMREEKGAYAPLTVHGTVVVDNVAMSCYALIESQALAHWVFAPFRLYYQLTSSLWDGPSHDQTLQKGVHWYPSFFYRYGISLVEPTLLHPTAAGS
ncbi:hypothetical protein Bbelb_392530 [Branchiostoma belcheri]|nr:hypothetical protein Bbelb_392530 [Branchiostoma belcheri]